MSKKSFISGAITLIMAGLVVRVLGFVYRIYLSNLIGAEGMGLFQLIAPIYSLIILTITSGISIAVSKMVAQELAKNHIINLRRITKCALFIVLGAGVIVSIFILIFSGVISNVILKDSRTYYSVILLIPCIPAIAAASALKGYFYGIQDVTPTAISQIVEQIVRIGLVVAMAGYFVKIGLDYACALATIGMAVGEMSNLFVLAIIYKIKKKNSFKKLSRNGFIRKRVIIKELLEISLPISFNRFITSIMSAVEMILIPRRLLAGGLDYQNSIEEYGKLSGMVMPLIFFPSVVTSALATTLVPAISEAISLRNFKSVNYRISKSIQLTFILGIIFTSIFLNYHNEIGNMLYSKEKVGQTLYLLSFSCTFLYLQQTLLGILNGLGKQGISLRNSMLGYIIRICFVYFCIPLYGVKGYVWGIVLSTAFVCFLNIAAVMKDTGLALDLRNWIIKPGLVGVLMLFSGKYIKAFFYIFNLNNNWIIVLTIFANIAIAISLMVITGALERKEVLKIFGFNDNKKR